MPSVYTLRQGHVPLLISMPHNASQIPAELAQRMEPYARQAPDTDWFLDRLYDFAADMGCSILQPHYSRYVVDLNRPSDDTNLYPGADTTGLCPTSCFDRRQIYLQNQEPDEIEVQQRVQTYWQPYHQALEQEIQRLQERFGCLAVYDAHSIASHVPRFFEGQLPDLNLGTNASASCAVELEQALTEVARKSGYSWVLNGRFKGGYITRHYAYPAGEIHSFQLELSQATYLNEQDRSWEPGKASGIRPVLRHFVETILEWLQTRSS